ncbi:MAG: T9SS type A sorting domain-containing protein [Flavobacteriales bacterium]|nr:T9SS type A sorting domain-containing protein [Flavobacteriales bacterium]
MNHSLKTFLLVVVYFLYIQDILSQSFTNNAAHNFTDGTVYTTTFNVTGVGSGKVLKQVTLKFGDASMYSGDLTRAIIKLKDPNGNEINIIDPPSFNNSSTTTDADRKHLNITLRDHVALNTPYGYASATGNTVSDCYPFNYGYWRVPVIGSYSNFTGTNGTWTLTISFPGLSTSYARKYLSSTLVFADPFQFQDFIASKPNQSCATRQCIQTGTVYTGTNNGYPQNQGLPFTIDGCKWNNDDNHAAWYYFVASSSTVDFSISGMTRRLQTVVVRSTNCSSFTLANGGCQGLMFNSTPNYTQYYKQSYTAGNGTSQNHAYHLTGLTVGQEYILIIDGEGSGAQSNFYIEIESGADNGCTPPLPITLAALNANCENNRFRINWTTASEINVKQFIVQRSLDGIVWEDAEKVTAHGNSSVAIDYSVNDAATSDLMYYKLVSEDYDGETQIYGPISAACNDNQNGWQVWPVPVESVINIKIKSTVQQDETISFTDLNGCVLLSYPVKLEVGSNYFVIDLSKLASGTFIVKMQQADTYNPLKFIKLQ